MGGGKQYDDFENRVAGMTIGVCDVMELNYFGSSDLLSQSSAGDKHYQHG